MADTLSLVRPLGAARERRLQAALLARLERFSFRNHPALRVSPDLEGYRDFTFGGRAGLRFQSSRARTSPRRGIRSRTVPGTRPLRSIQLPRPSGAGLGADVRRTPYAAGHATGVPHGRPAVDAARDVGPQSARRALPGELRECHGLHAGLGPQLGKRASGRRYPQAGARHSRELPTRRAHRAYRGLVRPEPTRTCPQGAQALQGLALMLTATCSARGFFHCE